MNSSDAPDARRATVALLVTMLTAAALVAAMAIVWLEPRMSGDTYMALAGGRDVVDGKLGGPDDWSCTTDDRTWMNQNWGSGLLFYAAYQLADGEGMVLVKAAAIVLMTVALLLAARRLGVDPPVAMLAVALMLLGMQRFIDMRPNLIGLSAVPVLMWLLLRTDDHPHRIWMAVAWVGLWSQVHGSYVFAIGMIGLWGLTLYVRRFLTGAQAESLRHDWPLLAAPVVAILLAVAGPFGIRNVTQPFNEMGGESGRLWRTVAEWMPVFSDTKSTVGEPRDFILLLGFMTGLCAAWLYVCWRAGRGPLGGCDDGRRQALLFNLALLGVAVTMAITARRLIPFAMVVAAPLVAVGLNWLLRDRRSAVRFAVLLPLALLLIAPIEGWFTERAAAEQVPRWARAEDAKTREWLVHSRLAWPIGAAVLACVPVTAVFVGRSDRTERRSGRGRARRPAPDRTRSASAVRVVWPTVVLAVVSLAIIWPRAAYLRWWYDDQNVGLPTENLFERMVNHASFPAGAMQFATANEIAGPAFNTWSWEGFIHWQAPGIKVFIGGRARQVYDLETYVKFLRILGGESFDELPGLGLHLIVVDVHAEPQIMRTIAAADAEWAPIYFDGHTWIVAHRGAAETNHLIDRAAAGQLAYPDAASAALSRAACLSARTVGSSGKEILAAVRQANELQPTRLVYTLVGRAVDAGKLDERQAIAYLESEAQRLAEIDYHRPRGIWILESRAAIARMLAKRIADRGDPELAERWVAHRDDLDRLIAALARREPETPVGRVPPASVDERSAGSNDR